MCACVYRLMQERVDIYMYREGIGERGLFLGFLGPMGWEIYSVYSVSHVYIVERKSFARERCVYMYRYSSRK